MKTHDPWDNGYMLVEDWRLVVVPTARGWRACLLWDDGVEVVEDVEVDDVPHP